MAVQEAMRVDMQK
jgi:ABC-type transporter Mla subunit MlaD